MTPEVSRALAVVKNRLDLGTVATERLVAQYGTAPTIEALPKWISEVSDEESNTRSATYGSVAVVDDLWLRERAQQVLLRFNPHHDKSGRFGSGGGGPLTGQAALDAAPAQFTPGPDTHSGNTAGSKLDAPAGAGSAEALAEYEGVEYVTTNSYLRHGPRTEKDLDPSDPFHGMDAESNRENAHRVAEIDKTMAVSRLQSDVQVERVIKRGSEVFGRDAWYGDIIDWNSNDFDKQDRQVEVWESGKRPSLKGAKWREKGYVSTTADPKITRAYGKRFKGVNSKLDGEPVVMRIRVRKGTGAVRLSPIGPRSEAELLLQHDLVAVVTADHGVGADGLRHIDVEMGPK